MHGSVLGTIQKLRNPPRGRSLQDYIRLQGGREDTPKDYNETCIGIGIGIDTGQFNYWYWFKYW